MAALIECRLDPITDVEQVGQHWRDLQDRSDCSYFLSWNWIGTWLRLLPEDISPVLFTATSADRIVGLAVLVSRTAHRHGFVRSRALFVNKTGNEALDEITIEYNDFLCDSSFRDAVRQAAGDYLIAEGWDEVFVDAATAGAQTSASNWTMRRRMPWEAHGVDLQDLRERGTAYLDALNGNTRYQIRRALALYEKCGPLRVQHADNLPDAEAAMDQLRTWHQATWQSRGLPGAFSNAFLDRFHRQLLAPGLANGEIQILRIGFGDTWIACLYNFQWRGAVLNYQTGFNYQALAEHNWPGAIAHYVAIEFNRLQGARYYDFLGGDNQQKRTLSTRSVPLDWMVLQRNSLAFRMEDRLRSLRNRLHINVARVARSQPGAWESNIKKMKDQ